MGVKAATLVDSALGSRLTKGGLDDVDDGLAGVDVGDDLATARMVIGALLEDDDLRLLSITDRVSDRFKFVGGLTTSSARLLATL